MLALRVLALCRRPRVLLTSRITPRVHHLSALAPHRVASSGFFFAVRFFFLARGNVGVAKALATGPRGTTEARSGERGPNTPDKRWSGNRGGGTPAANYGR